MQDIKVYPFNPSQKLYHVIDNTGGNGWVKASCGGKEVFDKWDTEKYLMINNPEEEKIYNTIKNIYALTSLHPSGYIGYGGNQVLVVKLETDPDTIAISQSKTLKILGTFTNSPNLYTMWYSTGSKPVNGYSVYWLYQGTEYEGLSERYWYPSHSLEELANKLTYPVRNASNYYNGYLNRDDNFWTNFSPTPALKDVILTIVE